MLTAILVILLFMLLILPHEFGHMIAARACGVQVNEFAFGMGPTILKRQGRETLYSLRAFPLGGFCAMEGEDTDEAGDNPRAFNNKKWWQKIIILLAGVTMNIVIAILCITLVALIGGMLTTTLSQVTAGSPADLAGLEAGDRIISVEAKRTPEWSDVISVLQEELADGGSVEVTFERDGAEKTVEMVPVMQDGRYVIGIQAGVSHSVLRSVGYGFRGTWNMVKMLFGSLGQLFRSRNVLDQVSGPVGIIQVVNEASGQGVWYYLSLVALISLNLAIFNLLPFPALDGGRMIFVIVRLITGKAISDRTEGIVHTIGMFLLIGLFILVTWNDIARLLR